MRDIGIPNGLAEVGYGDADVDDLVDGRAQAAAAAGHRAARRATEEDLAGVFRAVDGTLVSDRRPRSSSPRCAARGVTDVDDSGADPGAVLLRRLALPRRAAGGRRGRGTPTRSRRVARRRAARLGVPLTMRGAGTSIAGNAVGTGIVVDTVRHLNRVVVDRPRGTRPRVVQPGVVHAGLQQAARAARPALRPGPVDAHPLHDRRDDRQQRLRLAGARLRPDRRQRGRRSTCRLRGDGWRGRHRSVADGRGCARSSTEHLAHVRTELRPVRPPGLAATRSSTCCPEHGRDVDRVPGRHRRARSRWSSARPSGWSTTRPTGCWSCSATRR